MAGGIDKNSPDNRDEFRLASIQAGSRYRRAISHTDGSDAGPFMGSANSGFWLPRLARADPDGCNPDRIANQWLDNPRGATDGRGLPYLTH